jgi:integrating conjugative element protein (TIGR03746 family)
MTIHIPPELRFGANLKSGDVPKANLYTFAGYIFQQLNRWESNGEKNYAEQIFSTSPFLTPSFQKFLVNDMEERHQAGELSRRVRYIQTIPGQGYEDRRVDVLDNSNWVVWIDFSIHEYVNALKVKTVYIRYPFLVTRYDIDPEKNPWGLALNGFAEPGPSKLTKEQLTGEIK